MKSIATMTHLLNVPEKVRSSATVLSSESVDLKPREHGAYAILLVPIALSLVVAGPSMAGGCVALSAIAGFFAHEPLLIVLGSRGSRAQRSTPQAKSRLWKLVAVAVTSGLLAMAFSETAGRLALLVCLVLAFTSFAIAIAGNHRSLAGQLWGVVGLSAPCVPILLAGGVSNGDAMRIWAVFLLGFLTTTLAVRGVIAKQKRQSRSPHWTFLVACTGGFVVMLAMTHHWLLASAPMIAISWYLMLQPPPAKYLRRVGWSLVSGTMVTAVATAVVFWSV